MDTEESPIWGKLSPLAKGLNTYPLKESKILVGRSEKHCKIIISEKRLSSQHCSIEKEGEKVYLTDLSTNGTYLNTQKIGKGNRVAFNQGDELWLLPISKVSQEETIGFRFSFVGQQAKKREGAQLDTEKFMSSLKDQITCPLCQQIMIYPVITQPCNHRFCGPCLTNYVNNGKGQCAICRKQLISAARDSNFSAIIDDYIRSNPEQQRNQEEDANIFGFTPTSIRAIISGVDEEDMKPEIPPVAREETLRRNASEDLREIDIMEDENVFKVEFEPQQPQKRGRGRGSGGPQSQSRPRGRSKKSKSFISSDISASTDNEANIIPSLTCQECRQERNGFKCEPTQIHINCHNCHKPFPIREEDKLHQRCTICRSYYCNLYMPPCQKNGPKLQLLGRRAQSCKIEPIFFRNNRVEMDAFKNLLISQKTSLKDMFKDMLSLAESGRFQFMFDKKILRNPPAVEKTVRLDKHSPVCDNCWRELWFQMIFMFVKEHAYLMPDSIKKRPVCYWGINCRTMEHNLEHSKKYSHMDYQTRF